MNGSNGQGSVYVWSEKGGQVRRVTDPLFDAGAPSWDPEGKYLFFLSEREFAPQLSTVEFNFATNRTTGIFALALRADVPHLFPPESDEVKIGDDKDKKSDDAKADEKKPDAPADDKPAADAKPADAKPAAAKADPKADLAIDFDGLERRVIRVPLPADNYNGLAATKTGLLYAVNGAGYYGRDSDRDRSLRFYAFKDRKETTLVGDMGGYALSADGSKVLVSLGSGGGSASYGLYDASATGASSK
jgi:tricorn protease